MAQKEKLTVIKVGGKIVEEENTLHQLLDDFAAIEGHKVLVHGGGRSATKLATRLGIESRMLNGRRITDADMLQVVTMVYGGLVNKNIVAGLQARGVNALGDGGLCYHRRLLSDFRSDYGCSIRRITEFGRPCSSGVCRLIHRFNLFGDRSLLGNSQNSKHFL